MTTFAASHGLALITSCAFIFVALTWVAEELPQPRESQVAVGGGGGQIDDGSALFFALTGGRSSNETTTTPLPWRAACAVESAARLHPSRRVVVLSTSGGELVSRSAAGRFLSRHHRNVHFETLDLNAAFDGTPLAAWFANASAYSGGKYEVEHTSDAVRLAVLHDRGGVYLDTDVLCVRPLSSQLRNAVGLQSARVLNGAVLAHFAPGHPFLRLAMRRFAAHYDRGAWAAQGPLLLTRTLYEACGVVDAWRQRRRARTCLDVQVLPRRAFYPVPYDAWRTLFLRGSARWTPPPKDTYAVHLWNHLSRGRVVTTGDGSLFDRLAAQFCPRVHRHAARTTGRL